MLTGKRTGNDGKSASGYRGLSGPVLSALNTVSHLLLEITHEVAANCGEFEARCSLVAGQGQADVSSREDEL